PVPVEPVPGRPRAVGSHDLVPVAGLPALTESVMSVAQRYDRAGLWVAIVVTLGWHVTGVVPVVAESWLRYGLATSGVVTWLFYGGAGAAAAGVALRGGGYGLALPLAVCPILLAGSVIGSLVTPGGVIGHVNWPFTMVGWFAVLALWRRPLAELIAFYIAN